MNTTELQQIIKDHKLWLENDGFSGKRADLSRANLSRADLFGANLSRADLSRADLFGANLSRANLFGANLFGANLSRADLSGADLFGANLFGANLFGANLSDAILSFAIYQFFVGKHNAVATPTELRIGCEVHSWEYWLKEYKNIGKKNGYTTTEIKQHIIMIKAMHKCIFLAGDKEP